MNTNENMSIIKLSSIASDIESSYISKEAGKAIPPGIISKMKQSGRAVIDKIIGAKNSIKSGLSNAKANAKTHYEMMGVARDTLPSKIRSMVRKDSTLGRMGGDARYFEAIKPLQNGTAIKDYRSAIGNLTKAKQSPKGIADRVLKLVGQDKVSRATNKALKAQKRVGEAAVRVANIPGSIKSIIKEEKSNAGLRQGFKDFIASGLN